MDDTRCMQEALALARRGRGRVEPNPMVGAVMVDADGRIVGRGWHARFGGAHAEVEALRDVRGKGADGAGMTAYVTLEPCSHTGRTPPCADALIEAGVGRVVAAMIDPSPHAAGAGLTRLREAGIEVEVGVCESQARLLNAPFLKRVTTGLPWVIGKWAQTLDGRIATATGDSRWITGEAARHRVHELRARMDAVVIGIGTALSDDPQLNARGVDVLREARRVVIDPDLKLPERARLARDPEKLTLALDQTLLESDHERVQTWRGRGVELVGLAKGRDTGSEVMGWSQEPASGSYPPFPVSGRPVPGRRHSTEGVVHRLCLRPLLAHLVEHHEATNVLIEGGAGVHGAMLSQGLVDQVLAFIAPRLLADGRARPVAVGRKAQDIDQALPLNLKAMERLGEDVLLDYRVAH